MRLRTPPTASASGRKDRGQPLTGGCPLGVARQARKGKTIMISANIPNSTRRAVYARDGYRCALCDSTKYLQIHHYCPRSLGGNDTPHNLITLCADCHALAHGTVLRDWQLATRYINGLPVGVRAHEGITQGDVDQACAEYLADLYAPEWWPYK